MAADWIKWVKGLSRRREVLVIARTLAISRREAACACMELWEWADSETVDGRIPGATGDDIDAMMKLPGFAAALQSPEVGWLLESKDGIEFPRWSRNNGETAKRRATNAANKRAQRQRPEPRPKRSCIPKKVKQAVVERDGFTCRYCGWKFTDDSLAKLPYVNMQGVSMCFDHVTPVTQGGDNSVGNIVVACSKCNGEKGDRTPEQWGRPLQPPVGTVSLKCHSKRHSNVTHNREEKRREEITKPPPPTPASVAKADPAQGPWVVVEEKLLSYGLARARDAVDAAQASGCEASVVLNLVEFWRSRRPAWSEGALYERILNLRPGQDFTALWPPVAAQTASAEEKHRAWLQKNRQQLEERERRRREQERLKQENATNGFDAVTELRRLTQQEPTP